MAKGSLRRKVIKSKGMIAVTECIHRWEFSEGESGKRRIAEFSFGKAILSERKNGYQPILHEHERMFAGA